MRNQSHLNLKKETTMSLYQRAINELNREIINAHESLASMRNSFFKSEKTCQIREKMKAQIEILLDDLLLLQKEYLRLASERKQSEVDKTTFYVNYNQMTQNVQ
jgi:hypothetical protein